jgi:Na+-driven multidrug efflux pump
MLTFIVAIIVLGLTQAISILVAFRYGKSDNQTLPPSTAARKTSIIGTLIGIAIAASPWLQEPLPALAPEIDAAHFLPFLALFLAALFVVLLAVLRHLEEF